MSTVQARSQITLTGRRLRPRLILVPHAHLRPRLVPGKVVRMVPVQAQVAPARVHVVDRVAGVNQQVGYLGPKSWVRTNVT